MLAHEHKFSKGDSGTSSESAFPSKHQQKSSINKGNNRKNQGAPRTDKKDKEQPQSKGKFPPCGICNKTNHLEKDCYHKGKPKCNHCKKFGHSEKDCWHKQKQQPSSTNARVSNEAEDSLFYARQAMSACSSKERWLIDSGCTPHMTNNSSIFCKLDSSIKVPVRMGNGAIVKSTGKGTIGVQTKKGMKYINDVLLVPDLNESLLSVAQMVKNGYSLVFQNNHCTIIDPEKKEIAKVPMENKSFLLKWDYPVENVNATHSGDTWLWHRRYGHFNMRALGELHKKNLVRDFPSICITKDLCEPCQLGKQHRLPFPKEKVWRASEKLQLVHTDVCGPHTKPYLLLKTSISSSSSMI